MPNSDKVHVLSHPVINARLSKLRQSDASSKEFREVYDGAVKDCSICVLTVYIGHPRNKLAAGFRG